MVFLIFSPNFHIKADTKKNRADRLTVEAIRKTKKLILKAPAAMVKTLYGIGVKPAIPTAQALYC